MSNNKEESEAQVESDCPILLRLPERPANSLHDMLRSGSILSEDRFNVQLENGRCGEVKVDNWILDAKVVDLRTAVTSFKSIDNITYKTADVRQMIICKEKDVQVTPDEQSPTKHEKKNPNIVLKKCLCPHGPSHALNNDRKLEKRKYCEDPEVEKEVMVKRLLRDDYKAVSVKWEVIGEVDEKEIHIKEEPMGPDDQGTLDASANNTQNTLAEHEIFGEPVSKSRKVEFHFNLVEIEEEDDSPLSADDAIISDPSMQLILDDIKRVFSPGSALSFSLIAFFYEIGALRDRVGNGLMFIAEERIRDASGRILRKMLERRHNAM